MDSKRDSAQFRCSTSRKNQINTLNPKVNFLVIGTQKAGTSALDHYLRSHPQIGMANTKELHFFDDDRLFASNDVDYSQYEKQFNFSQGKRIYGEATPIYIYWQDCCRRIWEYNQEIKLITILRNPVERAFSHWNMEYQRKDDTMDFGTAIRCERDRCRAALPYQHRVFSYLDRGFYSSQIRRFKKYFPDNQLLFIRYEEFKKNQFYELKRIFDFLGVDSEEFKYHKSELFATSYIQEMTDDQINFLIDEFRYDIMEVERLLDWDCSSWLT